MAEMSERQFDPVEAMGHDGAEIKRLRARMAELEEALRRLQDPAPFASGPQIEDELRARAFFARASLEKP